MKFKLSLLLVLFFFAAVPLLKAQVFWTETFNNGGASASGVGYTGINGTWTQTTSASGFPDDPATGSSWYVSCNELGQPVGGCGTGCGGAGDATMHIASCLAFGGDNGAAYFAGGLCPGSCVTSDRRIESPSINCTGKSNMTLKINYITNGEPGFDYAIVWYFDGTTWNIIPTAGANPLTITPLCGVQGQWSTISFPLPATCNNVNGVKVGIEWINNDNGFGTDPSIALDSITLATPVSTNTKPVAVNDNGSTPSGTAVALNLLTNDSDPDAGQTITMNTTMITNPVHGSVSGAGANGSITYTPTAGCCGIDSFSYSICDNGATSLCDTAWVFITVGNVPPVPTGLAATSNSLCVGNTINICATAAVGATLVWSGPNSFTSNLSCISISNIALTDSGSYCVHQYITAGCNSANVCTPIHIYPIPATPIASNNGPVCQGQPCNLTANPNGSPAAGTWSWSGPNSFTSSSQNATIPATNAAQNGSYTVTHTVNGCTSAASAATVVDTIFCIIPAANFSVSPNDTICSGSTISVTDLSTNSPTTWSWNFNASATGGIIASMPTSNVQNPGAVTYSSSLNTAATVQISLVVANGAGTSGTYSFSVVILPGPPSSSINASAASVCAGNAINFSDASANSPTSWSWTFPNGTPPSATSKNPGNVTFNTIGTQNVTLVATNMCGSTTATLPITVKTLPTANFNLNPPYCNNQTINFFDNSSNGPTSWQWTFGAAGSGNDTSTLQNPTHLYPTPGVYNIQLIATNNCGSSAPFILPITINNCAPAVANFGIPADTFCMNTPIQLSDSSLNGPNVLFWSMTGANPGTSNLPNPVISYSTPGTFTITLKAQNFYGGPSTISKTVVILSCLPPNADFIAPSNVCAGQCIDITNISTEPPYTSVWAFTGSDTTASTQIDPTHICYDVPGVYTIQLQSFNFYGPSNVMVKSINVLPAPRIITPNTTIVAGNSVTLQAYGMGTITWTPKLGLNTDTGIQVITTPVNNIFYTIRDTSGCPSPDTVYISLIYQNAIVTVPNAFTPDNDGINDLFRVASNVPLNEYSMRVFNRWGEIVFHNNDYTQGWDGRYKGVEQNSGVFIYIINYQDLGDGEYKTLTGNVTLIR